MQNWKKLLSESSFLNKAVKADAFVMADPYHLHYYTGFTGGCGWAVISDKIRVLFTDSRYTEAAAMEAPEFEVIDVAAYPNYYKALAEVFLQNGFQSIGFEEATILYHDMKQMIHHCPPEIKWVEASGWMDEHRMIKSEEEIACIRKAEAIGDAAFEKVLPMIKAGVSEAEIALQLEAAMKRSGASGLSFDTIVASGTHSSMPHAGVTDKLLEDGDMVTMDFGCVYKGYCSDMTRTVCVGEPSDQLKEIYEVVLEAQVAALAEIGPGKCCKEVDAVARNIIADAGYGSYFGHGLGHSVGLFIHESPRLSPTCSEILRPGMTMTVEPGIYLPGIGGVRIEDLVVITESGYENLTHSPKNLIIR